MPQLDHVSYFSQFFWVSIIFLSFYIILVKSLLPRVATVLKMRKKLILNSSSEVSLSGKASTEIGSYEKVLNESIKETKALLSNVSKNSSEWVKLTSEKISLSNLQESNSKYIEAIADVLSKKYVIKSLLNK